MRSPTVLLLIAASVTAQSPLTTTFANNNGGSVGGAVYFELECLDPAGLSIFDLDLNFGGAGGLTGSIDIYYKDSSFSPHTSPDWIGPISSGNIGSSMPAGTPTNIGLAPTLQLGFGCKVGVAIVANGLAHAYTTATTLPSTFATAELELTVGGGSNTPFTGGFFFPRLVNTNINYVAGGVCPDIATVSSQGDGCGGGSVFASFYEIMAPGDFDLNGMRVTGTNNGSGYDITLAAGAGFAVPLGSNEIVGLGDDTSVDTNLFGGTLGLWAGSNCWLATGAGNSNGFAPSVGTFLGNPSTGVYSWTDLQPNAAGSGQVYYDEPGAGTIGRLTYNGVYGWNTTDENFVQITYDTANGDFTIEWGATGAGNPEDWLVGYSPGGANADPGNTDISAAAPFSIPDMDDIVLDLVLTPMGRPIQLATPVDYDVTTENIPAGAIGHMGIFGMTRPGIELSGLGLPTCFLNASLDVLVFEVLPPNTTSHTWTSVTLPGFGPFRRTYNFNLQSVIFGTSFNNFLNLGAMTSNGLKCKTGKL